MFAKTKIKNKKLKKRLPIKVSEGQFNRNIKNPILGDQSNLLRNFWNWRRFTLEPEKILHHLGCGILFRLQSRNYSLC